MKDKKNIKVRDLKPSKDAKGGHGHKAAQGFGAQGVGAQGGGGVGHRRQGKGHHHQER